jgi:hypothetical protein
MVQKGRKRLQKNKLGPHATYQPYIIAKYFDLVLLYVARVLRVIYVSFFIFRPRNSDYQSRVQRPEATARCAPLG